MSPVAHAGLGLLGWQIFDRKKTAGTLFLFLLIANGPDIDFLLHTIFKGHALFIHQYFTHNLLFTLGLSVCASLLLSDARSRIGLILTGLSHLAVDLVVIDTLSPVGLRLFYPISGTFYNLPWFPYLKRGTWEVMTSTRNFEVLALEFAIFVLPVLVIFFKPLRKRLTSAAFWKM
ncbi:MAG: metal-dependent hydrolase [Candidatus Aminicenantales bacterium]